MKKKIIAFTLTLLFFSLPAIGDGYFEKAKTSFAKEKYKKTRKYLKKSLKNDPDNIQARFLLADTYCAQKRFKTAIKIYRNIIQRFPENNEAFSKLGAVYFSGEFYRDSIGIYKQALEKEPDNINFLYMLGMSHARCMDLDNAYMIYRRIKKRDEKLAENLLHQIQGHLT